MDESKTQAWLACVELLNKAKNEFVSESIDALRREVDNKNIDIRGQTISAPEDSNENEREEIVLNKITDEYEDMRGKYEPYLSADLSSADAETIERTEKLRKFMLSLEKISILMGYARLCDEWMQDAAMEVKMDSPSEILAKTIAGKPERKEMLEFMLHSREMVNSGAFAEIEIKIIGDALSSSQN